MSTKTSKKSKNSAQKVVVKSDVIYSQTPPGPQSQDFPKSAQINPFWMSSPLFWMY